MGTTARVFTTMAAVALVGVSFVSAAGLHDYAGTYVNPDKNTRGITKVKVDCTRRGAQVQVWGKAHPHDSDFGKVNAVPFGGSVGARLGRDTQALFAEYNHGFGRRRLVLKKSGPRLIVEEYMQFTDSSRRTNYATIYGLNKFKIDPNLIRAITPKPVHTGRIIPGVIANIGPKEDKIGFNWRTTVIKKVGNRFKMADGNHWIMDFGTNRKEAYQALGVIRFYKMNSICFVGRPNPSMTYFLTNDRAPTGRMPGEDTISFNPKRIEAKYVQGRWKIVEGSHWIMDFDQNGKECRQALAIIKKHGFTRQGFVGRPGPSMTYFVR